MINNATENFVADTDVQWEQVSDLVRRKIMSYDDKLMLVKVEFEKGGVGQLHEHYHSQTTFVESGSFDVTIDGETKTLKKGDVFYIPPHALHGAVCTEKGVLLDFFSPMREDFV
ncbi:cupin domain-containing protein [Jiulongibacter sp. NS-SX5]|uniref:cupin domain-containing protein n=1 Tax=Jiulongibacter sp. NS-SX5 TaxID=3463854 RepID=UPI004058EA07